jgi:hypothetical protein
MLEPAAIVSRPEGRAGRRPKLWKSSPRHPSSGCSAPPGRWCSGLPGHPGSGNSAFDRRYEPGAQAISYRLPSGSAM